MPTAHPSSSKTAADVKDAGEGVPVPAASPGTSESANKGRSRRPPLMLLALAGAAVAAAYGRFVLSMHLGPPLVMVGLGGMTLSLCAAALWRVIDPLTREERAVVQEVRAPHRLRELEREKQAVLKAIKEIELDFQMRKISEADYREMVERYRARALRLMGDLAAGDDYRVLIERELKARLAARTAVATENAPRMEPVAKPSVPATAASAATSRTKAVEINEGAVSMTKVSTSTGEAAACPGCGTANDSDAQFCKKCGTKIVRSADLV